MIDKCVRWNRDRWKRNRWIMGMSEKGEKRFMAIFMILVGLAIASPPPVNQNMGIYDTLFINFTESGCRNCHTSGVVDAHHNLVTTGEYDCTNCHLMVVL